MIKKIKTVFPTVLVMWISFMTILKIFGTQYAIMGFYMALFYTVRSQTEFEVKKYLKDITFQTTIAILAVIASQNPILSFCINLIVVFFIAYIFFSHSNPTGYILYFIELVFLQLRPLKIYEIPKLLIILLVFYTIMFLIFTIKNSIKPIESEEKSLVKEGFDLTEKYLNYLIEDKIDSKLIDDMNNLISSLYDSIFKSMIFPSKMKKKNISEYYMIMIIRRVLLFHKALEKREIDRHIIFIKEKALEIQQIKVAIIERNREKAIEIIEGMIKETESEDEFLKRNFSGIIVFLKKIVNEDTSIKNILVSDLRNNYIFAREFIKDYGVKLYYQMNEFRIAFALRLSTVTAITMTASLFIPIQYSYWLPINAVFIVKPLYEESRKFVRQRLFGTFAGSIPLTIILSINSSKQVCFLMFFIGSLFFYTSSVNSWKRNLWSTIFGTSLAAISLGAGKAIELKLFYIVLASIIATVANRFFLPKDALGVYINNYRNIGIISYHQVENIFKVKKSSKNQNIESLKIIYNSIQMHYIMRSMNKFIKEIIQDDKKRELIKVYNKITDTVFSLEKMYFLYASTNKEDKKEREIERIKKLIERFIYEVEINIEESIETLKRITKEADNASEEFKALIEVSE